MKSTDFDEFSDVWASAWEVVGRNITPRAVLAAFGLLQDFELADINRALVLHGRSQHGRNPPTASHVIELLGAVNPTGHPGADEAWAICVRMTGEDDTAVITGQMRAAWAIAWPVMDLGDKVGARMAFRGAYERQIAMASGPPRWEVSPGRNLEMREQRIAEAVRMSRLPSSALAIHGLPPSTGGNYCLP